MNYLGVTSLSSYSLGASDYFAVQQGIEGFNLADLGWGTANAKTVTLSFWVRSSLTGTFGGCFQNRLSNRSYPFSYTITSADTWEQKTVTVAGDTTGTWDTNNVGGIYLFFALGMGSNRSGTANAWNSGNYLGVSGATSVVGTSGATFYITGVQLEAGSVATPFERRHYGQELQLAQRYYQFINARVFQWEGYYNVAGYGMYAATAFPVKMRAAPTITAPSPSANGNTGAITFNGYEDSVLMSSVSSGAGSGYIYWSSTTYVTASAEL